VIESFDVSITPCNSVACSTASAESGTTSRSRDCLEPGYSIIDRGLSGSEAVMDDVDSLSVAGTSSIACSRCSYITGCDISDSVSNVVGVTVQPVCIITARSVGLA